MPIESSQNIGGPRPVGPVDARIVRTAAGAPESTPAASSANPTPAVTAAYKPSDTLDPGQAPVDVERVQVIRKAIQTGTYPVIPTKIADAMIAAGLLLRATA
jgi:negative regulator of flagellin synthesis FlgM